MPTDRHLPDRDPRRSGHTSRLPGRALRGLRGRRRVGLAVLALVAGVVLAAALLDLLPGSGGGAAVAEGSSPAPSHPASPGHGSPPFASAEDTVPASPPASSEAPATGPDVPGSGPGTFTVARAGLSRATGGNHYRVEVEDGLDVDPDEAADDIGEILADPRGWAHGGRTSFHQVADASAGLVIKIATPDTTDEICGRYGLDTGGEVNCRVGETVMVNLKRWELGSPTFDGPASEYRALIINHEVGHWLGHGHETCPGAGRPAPAMMQQIKGLKGCRSNAWPYDEHGRYLSGPSVP
ncbi:DUF3152 domain-containing protein [Streptomyces sp. B1I3]|uniref:DUF3152 domain-containing protein n=1 Tax=Streptomyces sp. B1I3 TaxID=3042264 RepID=UPI00277FDD33|nr:DUF3152 domain-containing protein [Streptomyces sp. B1I3]MDQ0794680.1 hypothetical protein [Streptomyces sp. B1I3]